jgi:ATP-dependent helicase/nuclease subunit A
VARVRDLLLDLRRLRSRASVAELIEAALAATDFEAVCVSQFQGQQRVANVRKVIELARTLERRRLLTLRDFVRSVRDLTEREPREPEAPLVGEQDDVVRLMTIHQAKGLEFPVVILVDLGRALERARSIIVLDDALGVVAAPTHGAGQFPQRNARLEEYRERELDRDRAEHARLLYVACTRARDELVLLEGKGDGRFLDGTGGDRHVWCHQVWEVLGTDRLREFLASAGDRAALSGADGVVASVERAEPYLGRSPTRPAEGAIPDDLPAGEAERAFVARVVGFARPAPTETVTSPTALADFRRCPRQYWYRHVIELPERGRGGLRARLLGTAAHAVLEAIDLERASRAEIAALLAARPEAVSLAARDVDVMASELDATLQALRAELRRGVEVVGRELAFLLPLPRSAPSLFVDGRIDLLLRREGRLVVRDYKYARASAPAAANYAAQLAAYQLATDASAAELVFLRGGPVVWPLAPLDAAAEAAALVQAGLALGRALARNDPAAFPRHPPGPAQCAELGCGYLGRCWGRAGSTGSARDAASETGAS